MTTRFSGYRCSICGSEFGPDEVTYICPKDRGNLDIVLDIASIKRHGLDALIRTEEPSLWRYQTILPVIDLFGDPKDGGINQRTPLRAAGWTPIYSPGRLKDKSGLQSLWIKDESRNPTASFKDRASAVLMARAIEIGAEVVVTASTGNAGAALAGMAAAIGHQAVIFAPKTAPPAKIAQLMVYGAKVLLVDGNYDAAFDLSVECADEFGWYCRNTGYNPFTTEGKKTAALEIWEQLGLNAQGLYLNQASKNLCVFVSVGDGNIISGLHKGFKDLHALGLLERIPRIFGIQSEGSAAIANAFQAGTEVIQPVAANTLADSISVDLPRDGLRALRAATQTTGAYIIVPDEEILTAIIDLGAVGVFAEPAGSTSFAGLMKAVRDGIIEPEDPVLVLNTGSGLKDVGAALQAAGEAPIIEPTLNAVKKII